MKALPLIVLRPRASTDKSAFFTGFSQPASSLLTKLSFGFFLMMFMAAFANAATFVVTKTADTNDGVCNTDCSLREAMAAANAASSDDIVSFSASPFNQGRTITLTGGQLFIENNGSLQINGPAPFGVNVSANNASRVLFINESVVVSLSNVVITQGNAPLGAGIFAANFSVVTLNNTTLSFNSASTSGGGIYKQPGGSLSMTGAAFASNSAAVHGGGAITMSNASFTNLIFLQNTSGQAGGGLYCDLAGYVQLDSVTFQQNSGSNAGGGVYVNTAASLSVLNSTIRNNGSLMGGAVMNLGSITVERSAIIDNRASGTMGGAGIANSGIANVTNATFTANLAFNGNGGGIYNFNGGIFNALHLTIAGNTAVVGGGVANPGGDLNARNCLIGDNTSTSGGPDVNGVLNSQGYNLVENVAGLTVAGVNTGNVLGMDAQLRPIFNNGGVTETITFLATSPAVDGGDPNGPTALDQRGMPRPQDGNLDGVSHPDIGAYEKSTTLFTVTKTTDSNDNLCDSDCSLREAVSRINAATTPDNAIIFGPIFDTEQTIPLTLGELVLTSTKSLFVKGTGRDRLAISGNNQSSILRFMSGSNAAMIGVTFSDGASSNGHAISLNPSTVLVLEDSTVRNNRGGGFWSNGGTLLLRRVNVLDNSSQGRGGGFYGGGTCVIADSLISGNTSVREGGGINSWERLYITNTVVESNRAIRDGTNSSGGAGIFFDGNLLLVNNSFIRNNETSDVGGGIYNNGFHLNLNNILVKNTIITGNRAATGGGIQNGFFSRMSVVNTTISRNTAWLRGGGIYNTGGGIENLLMIAYSTISYNSAGNEGGGIRVAAGNLNLSNSIVSNNIASNASSDISGSIISQGYNLIKNVVGGTVSGDTVSNIEGLDPRLDPVLRLNGGVTPTHALRRDSPALDHGGPSSIVVESDQRGFSRPFDDPNVSNAPGGNGSDIGAYERLSTDISPTLFDYDGDGKADLSVRRPSDNIWHLLRATAGYMAMEFGVAGDMLAPADYDGDGKTDVAMFRPSTGQWFIFNSGSQSFQTFSWGAVGDMPVPADHDGDGKADLVVFRSSTNTWYTRFSLTSSFSTVGFGAAGDKPVVGDFDGDGRADIALYRPSESNWYILKTGFGFFVQTWGEAGDIPVPADYDGDGSTDVAVFRPSTGQWFRIRSTAGFDVVNWGASGDKPVPADYDGDGKADVAVFRPSNGTWYIVGSTAGQIINSFGQDGDLPTQSAFIY